MGRRSGMKFVISCGTVKAVIHALKFFLKKGANTLAPTKIYLRMDLFIFATQ